MTTLDNQKTNKSDILSDNREKAREAWLKMNKERLDEIERKRLASIRAVLILNVLIMLCLLSNLIIQIL